MDDDYKENDYKTNVSSEEAENNDEAPAEDKEFFAKKVSSKKIFTLKELLIKAVIPACLVSALLGGILGGVISGAVYKKSAVPTVYNEEGVKKEDKSEVFGNSIQNTISTTVAETVLSTDKATETPTKKPPDKTPETTVKSGTYTSSTDKPSQSVELKPKDIYENNVDSVVSIEVSTDYSVSYGTGFIISEEGYIVTNYHVVSGGGNILVTLYDDSQYEAELVGHEEYNDLAVLKINPKTKIHSLVYGVSSDLSVGDSVYIIGNPLGDLTFTLTSGVVSALNRLVDIGNGIEINMFQTDAAVNSGNSGGPVFDEHGYVVGIASAKYAASSIEGLSFCIPIDDVRGMIDDIINNGFVSGKPLIGVTVYDREVVNYGFIETSRGINGAKIEAVGSGTPAEKAGLKVGDIIVKANDKEITSVSTLRTVLSGCHSGDILNLTVRRDQSDVNVSVVLGENVPGGPRTDDPNAYDL